MFKTVVLLVALVVCIVFSLLFMWVCFKTRYQVDIKYICDVKSTKRSSRKDKE